MAETFSGQCLCGNVSYTFEGPVHEVDACHCTMCQRWVGGPFIGLTPAGDVTLADEKTVTWYSSSEWAQRGFCAKCGSSLFYRLKEQPGFWAITLGTVNQTVEGQLGKEIFINEKPGNYALAGDHPRLTGEEFFASLQSSSDGQE